ncbi:hypothetical protein TNIN_76261 [Trichonephila inaurata madagascariensis]|uniref:Uncharacterized protein n=1 Tax=Trichonephila inaurata madagascariensis TaxID=2747483 RepID=A0A8X6WL60_9ARAC|nr:hypothetical protein TNIN_76261 [Trichonephila inaurata madagascariensis]
MAGRGRRPEAEESSSTSSDEEMPEGAVGRDSPEETAWSSRNAGVAPIPQRAPRRAFVRDVEGGQPDPPLPPRVTLTRGPSPRRPPREQPGREEPQPPAPEGPRRSDRQRELQQQRDQQQQQQRDQPQQQRDQREQRGRQ